MIIVIIKITIKIVNIMSSIGVELQNTIFVIKNGNHPKMMMMIKTLR